MTGKENYHKVSCLMEVRFAVWFCKLGVVLVVVAAAVVFVVYLFVIVLAFILAICEW
jgi:hypothetical protein